MKWLSERLNILAMRDGRMFSFLEEAVESKLLIFVYEFVDDLGIFAYFYV